MISDDEILKRFVKSEGALWSKQALGEVIFSKMSGFLQRENQEIKIYYIEDIRDNNIEEEKASPRAANAA